MGKRIGFVSTRIAGTDGVSLETFKWYQVLERNGFECFFFAGELDTPAERSFLEERAHFNHPEILEVQQECFGKAVKRTRALSERIHELKGRLKESLYEFNSRFALDFLIVENALAIPMNIPLGMAITEFIAERGIPSLGHHHDFRWERDRFLISSVEDYLHFAFPPNLPSLLHVTINSEASRQLSYRRGISNVVIPNVFDFHSLPSSSPSRAKALREELGFGEGELLILQPTRVVPRKWVERAIELVHMMGLERPRLVISHGTGDEGNLYAQRVLEYAKMMEVEIVYIGDRVGPSRTFKLDQEKKYTMDDIYTAADLVVYPSGYEGFGNAFIEAVYFKKPVVVNRYSRFIEDIEPYGFEVVAFDTFITRETVERIWEFLRSEFLQQALERNFEIGKTFFSYEVLERKLIPLVDPQNKAFCFNRAWFQEVSRRPPTCR